MSIPPGYPRLLALLIWISTGAAGCSAGPAQSEWVSPGPNGKLVYNTTPAGDRAANDDEADDEKESATKPQVSVTTSISDAYVPTGATSFSVADPTGFAVGDTIAIRRPTTPKWVHLMGMDTLLRDGRKQTWIGTSRSGVTERKITAISGSKLTVDIGLADSYDSK